MGLANYLRETRTELKHVSWPTRAQAVNFTVLVIVLSFAVALVLSSFDIGYDYLLEKFVIGEAGPALSPDLNLGAETATTTDSTADDVRVDITPVDTGTTP